MQNEQMQQMAGKVNIMDENLAQQQYARLKQGENAGDVSDPANKILKPGGDQTPNIEEIEEGCTGHDSRRA